MYPLSVTSLLWANLFKSKIFHYLSLLHFSFILSRRVLFTMESAAQPSMCNLTREWTCELCTRVFTRIDNLKRHKETVHRPEINNEDNTCSKCSTTFTRSDHLLRHMQTVHGAAKGKSRPVASDGPTCPVCNKILCCFDGLMSHMKEVHAVTTHCPCCRLTHKNITDAYIQRTMRNCRGYDKAPLATNRVNINGSKS